MKLTISFLLCGLVLGPAMAWADEPQNPAGLDQLRVNAEAGNVDAMLEIGILYEFGFHMADNKAYALAWYRLAAENGSAQAVERENLLKSSSNTKEIENANRFYDEIRAARTQSAPAKVETAPVADVAPAQMPATTPSPATPTAKKEVAPSPPSTSTTSAKPEAPALAPVVKKETTLPASAPATTSVNAEAPATPAAPTPPKKEESSPPAQIEPLQNTK